VPLHRRPLAHRRDGRLRRHHHRRRIPVADEDGPTFFDDGSRVRITVGDAAGAVVMVLGEDGSLLPVSGVRMAPGNPDFPGGGDATPVP